MTTTDWLLVGASKHDKLRPVYSSVYSSNVFKDSELKHRKNPRDYRNQKFLAWWDTKKDFLMPCETSSSEVLCFDLNSVF